MSLKGEQMPARRKSQNPAYILRKARRLAKEAIEAANQEAGRLIQAAVAEATALREETQRRRASFEREVIVHLREDQQRRLPFSLRVPITNLVVWTDLIKKEGGCFLTSLGSGVCYARDARVATVTVKGVTTLVEFGKPLETLLLKMSKEHDDCTEVEISCGSYQ